MFPSKKQQQKKERTLKNPRYPPHTASVDGAFWIHEEKIEIQTKKPTRQETGQGMKG